LTITKLIDKSFHMRENVVEVVKLNRKTKHWYRVERIIYSWYLLDWDVVCKKQVVNLLLLFCLSTTVCCLHKR